MSKTPIRYLLRNLPFDLAMGYLKRNFDFKPEILDTKTLNIAVAYGDFDAHHPALKLASLFGKLTSFNKETPLGQRLVFAANQSQLVKAQQEMGKLYPDGINACFGKLKPSHFKIAKSVFNGNTPVIMGIVNLTPDSFFDAGLYYQRADYGAIAQAMKEQGADILDLGAESTRPGSMPIEPKEQIQRLKPALSQMTQASQLPISVDTTSAEVADFALENGASMINDTSGLKEEKAMIEVLIRHKASYCLMHTQGSARNMQKNPVYSDVVAEVYAFFSQKLERLIAAGIPKERITLDPGIGFGKLLSHNLDLQRMLAAFKNLGCLMLLGASNKSFIEKALHRKADQRLPASLAMATLGWLAGASIFRVHQISETRDALSMANAFTHDLLSGP